MTGIVSNPVLPPNLGLGGGTNWSGIPGQKGDLWQIAGGQNGQRIYINTGTGNSAAPAATADQ